MLIQNNKILLAFGIRPVDLILNRQGMISPSQKIRLGESFHKYQRERLEGIVMVVIVMGLLILTVYTRGGINEINGFALALGFLNLMAAVMVIEQIVWMRKIHSHIKTGVVGKVEGELHKHSLFGHHEYFVIDHTRLSCLDKRAFEALHDREAYTVYYVGRWAISAELVKIPTVTPA